MSGKSLHTINWVSCCIYAFALVACLNVRVAAQPVKSYTIKNGKMYISLSKQLSEASLDSFISNYNLADMALKEFVRTSNPDSLHKLGWELEVNNKALFTISKPLFASEDVSKVVEKYIVTAMSGRTVNRVVVGYNSFKNKHSFAVSDSTVTFFLRNNLNAARVMLAGTFNNWSPSALAMTKTDTGWIAKVKLGGGKHLYKFIVNGNWMVDNDNNLKENDGKGNINSVFYKTNTLFTLGGFQNSRKVYVAGSFNNWKPNELLMNKTATGWQLPVYLGEGTHTYKFVVDGKWFADEKNKERLPNEFDDYNSVIKIGKPYLFKLNGYENAKRVALAGSFNNWRPFELLMNKTNDGWQLPYVIGPGNYEYKFVVDGKWIADAGNSFLVIKPNYTFRLKNFGSAKHVFVAGDLNSWNPNTLPMKKDGNDWVVSVHLSPGKHRYKFIVDGKWLLDPNNKLWEQNEYSTGNSIVWIE